MAVQGNTLQTTGLNGRAAHAMCRWVALSVIAVCAAAPYAIAQGDEDVPSIRVETREVLIPAVAVGWTHGTEVKLIGPGYEDAVHLGPVDFHVFEDEKEQTVASAALVRPYWTGLLRDNMGWEQGIALTPKGEWTNLRISPANVFLFSDPFYAIAYRPSDSPEGACHTIRITVNPKDASGHTLTTVESQPVSLWKTPITLSQEVKRSKLLLRYRTQYCNTPHSAADPLHGTAVSSELENLAVDPKAEEAGFYLGFFSTFDESGNSSVRVALDFPQLSDQTGIPGFKTSLLGIFKHANDGLAIRFSDNKDEGATFPLSKPDPLTRATFGRESFWNHYETEVTLPPGDYSLRVGIDFGGALRRAETLVKVESPAQRLTLSGIALCRRYFEHDQLPSKLQLSPDGVETMPLDLKPLVSKGFGFTPTGDTHFKANDPMAAYFEVFEPLLKDAQLLPGGGNAHVQFEMRIVDAKTREVKSDTGFQPADGFMNPDMPVIPISAQIAIGELAPGDYQLQVRANDSAGAETDWRTTSFTRE